MTINRKLIARANAVARKLNELTTPEAKKKVGLLGAGVGQLEKAEDNLGQFKASHLATREALKSAPKEMTALIRGAALVANRSAPELALPSPSLYGLTDSAAHAWAIVHAVRPLGRYYQIIVDVLLGACEAERKGCLRLQSSLARLQVAAQDQARARQQLVALTAEAQAFLHQQAPSTAFARRHALRRGAARRSTNASNHVKPVQPSNGATGPQVEACPLIASLIAQA